MRIRWIVDPGCCDLAVCNALVVLDLRLDVVEDARGFDLGGGLASESLHEDLHSTMKAKDGQLLPDVVAWQCAIVFACKNEALLIQGDALVVLDLCLNVVDDARGLDLGGGLAGESLHENLHSTTKMKDKMEHRLLHNAFAVLDLGPNVIDNVGRLNLKSDGLAGESLHENLHSITKTKDKMERRLLHNAFVVLDLGPMME